MDLAGHTAPLYRARAQINPFRATHGQDRPAREYYREGVQAAARVTFVFSLLKMAEFRTDGGGVLCEDLVRKVFEYDGHAEEARAACIAKGWGDVRRGPPWMFAQRFAGLRWRCPRPRTFRS